MRFLRPACLLSLALLVSCSDQPTDIDLDLGDVTFSIVSGDGQAGLAGEELPEPLVVVAEHNGRVLKRRLVNFVVTEGGGSMFAGSALTDNKGEARDWWTLGFAGDQKVEARAVDPATGEKLVFGTFTATVTNPTADPFVEVSVDWNRLDEIQVATTGSSDNEITHLGMRIVGADGSVLIHSFARTDGNEVFQLENPPTPTLSINLVAVRHASGPLALQFGVALDVPIDPVGLIAFALDDFEWSTAEWHVHPDVEAEYDTGTMVADANEERFLLPILYRDPFQVGVPPVFADLLTSINGTSFLGDNIDGWRRPEISATNPSVGVPNQSQHNFFPYVKSAPFGLPSDFGRYMIPPAGSFTVDWQ